MGRRAWVAVLAVALAAGLCPAGAGGQGRAQMTFWSWRGEDRAFYEGMIKQFEAQNPGTSIEFQTYKPTEYSTVLSAAMQAGKGPDIVHLRAYGALQPFARPEFLVPLEDKVPELKTFARQWLDGARSRADAGRSAWTEKSVGSSKPQRCSTARTTGCWIAATLSTFSTFE